ncbi:DUF2971 domain-containing protein [Pseudomonas sp. SG20052]|uniref:DUF2971 domain-containing protein n=1 Tax=Pseudomonas sp. SG20052 TaxID=3074147 RepID=UPI00287F923B|nr:DUF2971 domain-containing protein [Pseudomonas sp. SG20052]WNF54041.1 DUF2971 domain-containing protein [Pseudomonas sp. SG20052]
MNEDYPKYFYKYRAVSNSDDLSKDYAIDALLRNQAIFSSRKNFNDLFDSSIELIKPTPREFKEIKSLVGKDDRRLLSECIHKGLFTPAGLALINGFEESFNETIDSYGFMSVSKNPVSNLMWSHYADSHKGFCIEFRSEFMKAEKVSYQKVIPKLNTIDLHRLHFKIYEGDDIGHQIWRALRTKLDEWEYESEYRFQANNAMGRIPKGKKFIKIPYNENFVESIIFGCRMQDDVKKFIMRHMPGTVKFKQAVARTSTVEIINI